ncbi:MAG: PAS domain-containing sensor histidine kinase [Myxococcales bacterium]
MAEPYESRFGLGRELYENAACGLLSTESNGAIVDVNRTFCEWLGFTREELIARRRMQDLLTVGGKIFHQTHWMPLLQMQGAVVEVQLEMVHAGGRALPVLVNAARRSQHGVVRDDVAVFLLDDRRLYERELLLARKRAEELLESERAAKEELARVLRERGEEAQQRAILAEQLVGIVSHDLRSPLNAIVLNAAALHASGVSGVQARVASRIANSANRASRLIEDLLDFTQAQVGGGLRVTRRTFEVPATIRESIDELKLAWPGRALQYTHDGPSEANADPDRLAQIVTNLVNNALNYGSTVGPIVIRSGIASQPAPVLTLCVHNQGEPIPSELLPHIFEALRRGAQESTVGSRSVGLGLYIVRQIARAHGGDVRVESSRDAGTTFVVSIPLS